MNDNYKESLKLRHEHIVRKIAEFKLQIINNQKYSSQSEQYNQLTEKILEFNSNINKIVIDFELENNCEILVGSKIIKKLICLLNQL